MIAFSACSLVGCINQENVSTIVAKCESGAYSSIGVQPDQTASLDYLRKKKELARVCLVGSGLKFKTNDWGKHYSFLFEAASKRYGIWNEKPGSQRYEQFNDMANVEVERQSLIDSISPGFWER